ncbi:MAG: class I SAM-dependent methyltransferase [Segetibacter sp.]
MSKNNVQENFGDIDIYLFDQLLKGRFLDCKKVIDVGCGYGRNIIYFLKNGYDVFGIDQNEEAIREVQRLSKELSPPNPIENFQVALVEDIPFKNDFFDLVICNAVLHFALDEDHFNDMVQSVWRVLKPKGLLFARLASDIGIETVVSPVGNRRFLVPDGSYRFLVNEKMLLDITNALNGELYEPIKTTNVQNIRCMTTWCVRKM